MPPKKMRSKGKEKPFSKVGIRSNCRRGGGNKNLISETPSQSVQSSNPNSTSIPTTIYVSTPPPPPPPPAPSVVQYLPPMPQYTHPQNYKPYYNNPWQQYPRYDGF